MAGLVPAIHAAPFQDQSNIGSAGGGGVRINGWLEHVDGRDKPGHDDVSPLHVSRETSGSLK